MTITATGQIWFGYLTGGAVGCFDLRTGHVELYRFSDPQASIFSMASDTRGRIWFTEIAPGKLGMINPASNRVTEFTVPSLAGQPAGLYELAVTRTGDIWMANSSADAIVRYVPRTQAFTFFPMPPTYGGLYGLVLDSAGRLWFTMAGSQSNSIGEMVPPA